MLQHKMIFYLLGCFFLGLPSLALATTCSSLFVEADPKNAYAQALATKYHPIFVEQSITRELANYFITKHPFLRKFEPFVNFDTKTYVMVRNSLYKQMRLVSAKNGLEQKCYNIRGCSHCGSASCVSNRFWDAANLTNYMGDNKIIDQEIRDLVDSIFALNIFTLLFVDLDKKALYELNASSDSLNYLINGDQYRHVLQELNSFYQALAQLNIPIEHSN